MQIDKNVPMPDKGHGRKQYETKFSYLSKIIETWEVGDSVAFEFHRKKFESQSRTSFSAEAIALKGKAKAVGQKTSQRVMADEGVIRVWRVQ
jgi:hypothetical protein